MKNISCILCGSPQNNSFKITDTASESFTYYECSNKACRLISQYPIPGFEDLKSIYSSDYYKNWGDYYKNRDMVRNQKKETYAQAFSLFEIKPGMKVLDCGCATGALLQMGIERKWDIYGFDINPAAIEESRQIAGEDRVFHKQLDALSFQESSFDALCMFDYIEHPSDPKETIKCAAKLLKQGGYLYLTTPDTSHTLKNILNHYWPHFLKEHIHLFSRSNIKQLLEPWFEINYCGNFRKILSFAYIFDWTLSHNRIFSPLARTIKAIFPQSYLNKKIRLTTSEILVIGKKR